LEKQVNIERGPETATSDRRAEIRQNLRTAAKEIEFAKEKTGLNLKEHTPNSGNREELKIDRQDGRGRTSVPVEAKSNQA